MRIKLLPLFWMQGGNRSNRATPFVSVYSYELEGDEAAAVELFYDIWTNHPDTLWAHLAASRLALNE